jgi:hypothetical protein
MDYPWYDIIDSSMGLEQGDILPSWPFPVPKELPEGQSQLDAEIIEYDTIIMSQSCDISFKKIDLALLCPLTTLTEMAKKDKYKSLGDREKLRKGEVIGYHMLNKCEIDDFSEKCNLPSFVGEYLIVDFRNTVSFPLSLLIDGAKRRKESRLRLLPPYREHLSQAYARFIMRVGLPRDIPQFTDGSKSKC